MSKKTLDIYIPPILEIVSVTPSLEKDGVVYANTIKAKTDFGKEFIFRERKGLPVNQFIGKPMECVLEIIEVDFYIPKTKEEIKALPENIEKGEYLWTESGYKFIPQLVEMVEGHQDEEECDFDDDEFERLAIESLSNWGVSGFGLTYDQDKPMIRTDYGLFLFNEYRNENIIEKWELGQIIYFHPKEMLLRGIKPYQGPWQPTSKQQQEIATGPNEKVIRGPWRVIK